MRKPAILITGANGEIGQGLLTALQQQKAGNIITLDLQPLDYNICKVELEEITPDWNNVS